MLDMKHKQEILPRKQRKLELGSHLNKYSVFTVREYLYASIRVILCHPLYICGMYKYLAITPGTRSGAESFEA